MTSEVLLELKNLSKGYGSVRAVSALNLEIRAGEVFGLLGPNGAGKTTTINLIAGLLRPDGGQVLYRGQDTRGIASSFRNLIGICYQENVHWDKLTPREQLVFMGKMYGMEPRQISERCQLLLEALGLEDAAHRLAGRLSGGLQRRLNIALSLIHDPELIILDEPEAGLDPQSRIKIREFVKSLAGHKTVILTTHNMDEAERMADRVAIIDFGGLLILGTPRALISQVGEGDVLEICLLEGAPESLALDLPGEVAVIVADGLLQIRGLNLINHLPAILERIKETGLLAGEIRLRKNTLEDVFIQLTGRRLRE